MDILIVARAALLRECLRALLSARGFRIAGERLTVDTARRWLRTHAARVVVLDASGFGEEIPSLSGIDLPIVVVGSHRKREWRRAGAAAVLSPDVDVGSIAEVIRAAPAIEPHPAPEDAHATWEQLTQRQRDVLSLAMSGLTSPKIAETLGIGARTVETHRTVAMRRLGLTFHQLLISRLRLDAPP